MIKQCVTLNGQIINIGEWDYQIQRVETKPAIIDEETQEIIEPAEYEDIALYPLPDGARVEECEVYQDEDGAWRLVGYVVPKSAEERIAELESENLTNMLALVELHGMIISMGGGT